MTASLFIAPVQAATSTCSPTGTIAAGDYIIQANEWNSSLQQCITYTGGTAWSVTTANFNTATNGAPATYPSIFKGCHWGLCTSNSGLPIQTSKLTSATTSWSTTQIGSGMYNVAYDLWFNSTATTSGQPDGTELMIWLNRRDAWPFGSQTATASIAGFNWQVWTGQQSNWKVITYVLDPGATSFSNLNVLTLIKDAVSRGSVNSAHYLIDAEAGFEIWIGGQGLGVNSFSFSASAGSGTATPTPRSTATPSASVRPTASPSSAASATPRATATAGPGGSAGCSATYGIGSGWGTGFTANVTVKNTGSVPTKTWKVTWTWSGNQKITNYWNAAVTQSGTSVSATNLPYNGVIAGGGNTTFGFQASFSGANTNPTLACSAT
jgi:cellulose 1,4-beta-cellobiosidase